MPSIKDPNTVTAIAKAYCANGRKKEEALLTAGYKPSYANSYCGKIWEDKRIIDACNIEQARIEAKTGFTREVAEAELDEARVIAERKQAPNDMIAATRAKAKLYGLETERIESVLVDSGPPMATEERIRWHLEQANMLRQGLAAGTALADEVA